MPKLKPHEHGKGKLVKEPKERAGFVGYLVLWRRTAFCTILAFLCTLLQIDGAVDVLDDEDGAVGHPDEQPPQRGIPVHLGQLEIIDVKLEVVGHGRNEAGLAGPRRAVEQVPALLMQNIKYVSRQTRDNYVCFFIRTRVF